MDFGMDLYLAYIHCAIGKAQLDEKVIYKVILCKDLLLLKISGLTKACSKISIMWYN